MQPAGQRQLDNGNAVFCQLLGAFDLYVWLVDAAGLVSVDVTHAVVHALRVAVAGRALG